MATRTTIRLQRVGFRCMGTGGVRVGLQILGFTSFWPSVPTNNPVFLRCQGLAPFALGPAIKLEWTIPTMNEDAKMGMLTAELSYSRGVPAKIKSLGSKLAASCQARGA